MYNDKQKEVDLVSKKAKLRLIVYIVTSLLLSLAILLLITLVNLLLLFSTPDKLRGDFTVTIDDTDESTKPYLIQSVNVKTLCRQGKWYVNFSEIADYYQIAVSGDRSNLRYIFRNDTDDIMTVDFEKNTVSFNGVSVACEIPDMNSNGYVFLPVDMINTFFEGLEISYDIEEKTFRIECEEHCYLNVRNPETTPKIDKVQMP